MYYNVNPVQAFFFDISWIKFSNILYKMTFFVGHTNKCYIYRSVGGSAIYIIQIFSTKTAWFVLKNIVLGQQV